MIPFIKARLDQLYLYHAAETDTIELRILSAIINEYELLLKYLQEDVITRGESLATIEEYREWYRYAVKEIHKLREAREHP